MCITLDWQRPPLLQVSERFFFNGYLSLGGGSWSFFNGIALIDFFFVNSFSGFNTNSVASADLSGLEGLVNAAAAHDPASYYHHHQHHHHASHHQTAHGIQSHQMHHNAYQQHFHSAHHVQPPQITDRRSYFEESSSLLGLGSLAASSTSASASASTGTTTNNESYSPNSTTNNLPSSTVKIKSGT